MQLVGTKRSTKAAPNWNTVAKNCPVGGGAGAPPKIATYAEVTACNATGIASADRAIVSSRSPYTSTGRVTRAAAAAVLAFIARRSVSVTFEKGVSFADTKRGHFNLDGTELESGVDFGTAFDHMLGLAGHEGGHGRHTRAPVRIRKPRESVGNAGQPVHPGTP